MYMQINNKVLIDLRKNALGVRVRWLKWQD